MNGLLSAGDLTDALPAIPVYGVKMAHHVGRMPGQGMKKGPGLFAQILTLLL